MTRTPDKSVCIVGAGPAGMSCALWLKNLGFTPWLIECAQAGGMQNLNFLQNNSLLGFPNVTGPELAQSFVRHIQNEGIALTSAAKLKQIDPSLRVQWCDQQGTVYTRQACAVVIATGTRYRTQTVLENVAGFECVRPEDIRCGPYAFAPEALPATLRVLIIGGGDNAVENAQRLVALGAQVIVAARSKFRAQAALLDFVKSSVNGELVASAQVLKITQSEQGYEVSLACGAGQVEQRSVNRIHVLAGYEPQTDALEAALAPALWQALARDAQGYLLTDAAGRTGCTGIYAAGDICNVAFPSVVSALAQGAQVAKTIEADRR